jgi:nitroreductase
VAVASTEEIDRLLSTTRAVRRRLDLDRPVPRAVLLECIRLACFAPNASNGQDWRWIVVDDEDRRRQVADVYRRQVVPPVRQARAAKAAAGDEAGARMSATILELADHFERVPVLVVPCFDVGAARRRYLELLAEPERQRAAVTPAIPGAAMTSSMYASIYPAVWSFQLALHSRGLGSVLTTAHQGDQAAVAEILGIPGGWDQTCLIPVAYLRGPDLTPPARRPVDEVVFWNGVDRQ